MGSGVSGDPATSRATAPAPAPEGPGVQGEGGEARWDGGEPQPEPTLLLGDDKLGEVYGEHPGRPGAIDGELAATARP